jgi:hypothetical protein
VDGFGTWELSQLQWVVHNHHEKNPDPLKLFQLLLDNGADPNFGAEREVTDTAMRTALMKHNMEVMQILLFQGANIGPGPDATASSYFLAVEKDRSCRCSIPSHK